MKNDVINTPLVSIILPTYNGAFSILKAIKSVQSQTFQNWELLIIIDGSVDSTKDVILEYKKNDQRIKIIQNSTNLGIQKTLNIGLQNASGRYVARIDDDDQWIITEKLSKQVSFLEKNPEIVLVGTGMVLVDKDENEIGRYLLPENDYEIRKSILLKNCFAHPTVVFRKDTVTLLGGYSEMLKYRHIEDYELWMRVGLRGMFANLPIFSTAYTISSSSLSGKNKLKQLYRDIQLSIKFRKFYPSFFKGFMVGLVRLIVYLFFGKVITGSLRAKIISIYKKNTN